MKKIPMIESMTLKPLKHVPQALVRVHGCGLLQRAVVRGAMAILLGLWLSGCQSLPAEEGGKPRVVSTSTIIADLTQRIGEDEIEHQGILEPGADPHVYEPVPQDSVAFEKADLIFYNGYNLEPGLIKLMNAAGVNGKKFPVGEAIAPLDFDYQGQKVPDPHIWGNAVNGIKMVRAIRDQLIALFPRRSG